MLEMFQLRLALNENDHRDDLNLLEMTWKTHLLKKKRRFSFFPVLQCFLKVLVHVNDLVSELFNPILFLYDFSSQAGD